MCYVDMFLSQTLWRVVANNDTKSKKFIYLIKALLPDLKEIL